MIAPFMSRLRRRTFLLFTGLIIFLTLFLLSRRVGISDGLATTPFSANPPAGDKNGGGGDDRKSKLLGNDEMQKPLGPMVYGTSSRPPLKAMQQILGDLPSEYLLADSSVVDEEPHTPKGKRLIFVGDVHGQLPAFQALLAKLSFDKSNGDHLIMVGDMVNKGPDSAGVVQLAMELDASAVRGNHEDRVILAHAASIRASAAANVAANSTGVEQRSASSGARLARRDDGPEIMDNLEQEPFSHGDEEDRATAASLTPLQLTWLASLPVILRVGRIPGATSPPWDGTVVAVHAGLVPGLPLESQDPWVAMNMRSFVYPGEEVRRKQVKKALEKAAKEAAGKDVKITDAQVEKQVERLRQQRLRESGGEDSDRDVIVPAEKRQGDPWADIWDTRNKELAPEDRMVVVYGHDAKTGLRVGTDGEVGGERYAFGLDSGCIYGGQLSALVLEAGAGGVTHSIVQVDCEKVVAKNTD